MGLSRTLRGLLGGAGGGPGVGRGAGGGGALQVAALGLEAAERGALLQALRGDAAAGEGGDCRIEVSGRWLRVSASEGVVRRAHALVFVLDARDTLRVVVCREELCRYLGLSRTSAPLLVLVAHTDEPHALPIDKLAQGLGLSNVSGRAWHIAPMSALRDALTWLVTQSSQQQH